VIEVALVPGACMCSTRKLWTADADRTWHTTKALGDAFAGSTDGLYWWQEGSLYVLEGFPPRASKLATKVSDGTIVDADPIPGGVAALVSNRVDGKGWDGTPRVLIARADGVDTVELPAVEGEVIAEEIQADWPDLTVTGTDYAAEPSRAVTWSSTGGGQSWDAEP
jgi:hypothetical protein